MNCQICKEPFGEDAFLGMYIPGRDEKVYVCGGECSSEIIRYNQSVCAQCNLVTYPKYEAMNGGPDEITRFKCEACRYSL